MGGGRALALCPDAVVVRPRMSAYSEASRAVFAVFADTAAVVEALSIDEAFMDVRGLEHISGRPIEIAARLRQRVREEVGLPLTVGIATTKFVAKVASGVAKPDGLLLVEPGSLSAHSRAQIETIRNMTLRIHEIMQRFSSLEKEMNVVAQQAERDSGKSYAATATAAGA